MEDDEQPEAGPSIVRAPKAVPAGDGEDEDEEMDDNEEEDAPKDEGSAQAETQAEEPVYQAPPKILITTSPSPCKLTYQFCDDLKNVFPGGQFFKRPKGKGYELGRIARWSIKRHFDAVLVVNEDHKDPSEESN